MSEIKNPRELHRWQLFAYSMGYFGIFLTNLLISVFAFQFYVYTVNLDSFFTSVGVSINLVIVAISSQFFGVMTDNKKPGKFGKRRPYLLYGLPIWFLTSVLFWLPPWKCPENNPIYTPTLIYFWSLIIINGICGASILSAHAAMLPEQSQTHKNREKVSSMITILSIIASILAMLLPLIVQSKLPDPQNVEWWLPSGEILLIYMPMIGLGFAIFGIFSVILTFFSIDESFHKINSPVSKKASILDTFRKIAVPAKDKKYRKFLTVQFSNNAASKILGILVVPFLAFVLQFKANEFFIYIVVSISCKFGWFYLCRKIIKKKGFMKSFKLFILLSIIVSSVELLFLFKGLAFELNIVIFIITIGTLLGAVYIFGFYAPPLSTALIYEAARNMIGNNLDESISNISGSYSGINSFIVALGQAFASILMGFILVGSNKENPAIITLGIASMAIFYLISLIILKKIKVNQMN